MTISMDGLFAPALLAFLLLLGSTTSLISQAVGEPLHCNIYFGEELAKCLTMSEAEWEARLAKEVEEGALESKKTRKKIDKLFKDLGYSDWGNHCSVSQITDKTICRINRRVMTKYEDIWEIEVVVSDGMTTFILETPNGLYPGSAVIFRIDKYRAHKTLKQVNPRGNTHLAVFSDADTIIKQMRAGMKLLVVARGWPNRYERYITFDLNGFTNAHNWLLSKQ